jgi:hypothetical protein
MDIQAQISSLALFYYLTLIDERAALVATLRTWEQLKSKRSDWNRHLVAATLDGFNRFRGLQKLKLASSERLSIQVSGVDLGPWKEFRKKAPPEEFLAVVWTQVLAIAPSDVAKALGITEGTLKYRLSKALRLLGELSHGGRA